MFIESKRYRAIVELIQRYKGNKQLLEQVIEVQNEQIQELQHRVELAEDYIEVIGQFIIQENE